MALREIFRCCQLYCWSPPNLPTTTKVDRYKHLLVNNPLYLYFKTNITDPDSPTEDEKTSKESNSCNNTWDQTFHSSRTHSRRSLSLVSFKQEKRFKYAGLN